MGELPSGVVTFLFTDVEGSVRLLDEQPEDVAIEALARHEALLTAAILAHSGHIFSTGGDTLVAAFGSPTEAVVAALEGQRAVQCEPWGETGPLKVRIALHTGAAEPRGDRYHSVITYRAALLAGLARGGQILLSQATQELVRDNLPPETSIRDLGEYRLRNQKRPERRNPLREAQAPTTSF